VRSAGRASAGPSAGHAAVLSVVAEIGRVTARQLLGRRRTVLLVLLAAVPLLLGLMFRASGFHGASVLADRDFIASVFDALVITLLVPLIALLFGTAAFGAEIEDGTVVYLLAKPVQRAAVVAAKMAVACAAAVILSAGSTLLTGLVALSDVNGAGGVIRGYAVGAAAGAVVYGAVFVALSLLTSRALVAGLLYMLLWEGVLANFLSGIRFLSIRQYALGIADAAGVNGQISTGTLNGTTAVALAVIVTIGAGVVAVRRLQAFEIPQAD
jgi:ABC-2 type transport system permease protein